MARKSPPAQPVTASPDNAANETRKPLVFISHDTRDGDIAEAFTNLLTDASGGILQSFRSSDRKGVSGIEFGAEWYRTIMDRLDNATDVVALLTSYSINRPWLLYEAGVAKGKLDRVVFGLALGIPLSEANIGPFAQFQNSGDDEDSLTKLVLQLIRRNPDATPREEAVRRQVIAFQGTVAGLLKDRHEANPDGTTAEKDTENVAKLFEEVKAMFRELPERVEGTITAHMRRGFGGRRRKISPGFLEEFLFNPPTMEPRERVVAWLVAATPLRDDAPWLYDMLLEAQRAVMQSNSRTLSDLSRTLQHLQHTPAFDYALHESADPDTARSIYVLTRALPELLHKLAKEMPPRRSFSSAGRRVEKSLENPPDEKK